MAGNVAAVALAMLLAGFAWFAWRARALAASQLRTAREWESIARDAADLIAAALTNLELIQEEVEPSSMLADATCATRALANLLAATHLDALGRRGGQADTGGCVRIAIAIARSRGQGVRLRGTETELPVCGSASSSVEALSLLFAGLRTTAPHEYIDVVMQRDRVLVSASPRPPSIVLSLEARLAGCGWTLRRTDERTWEIAAAPDAADPRAARTEASMDVP